MNTDTEATEFPAAEIVLVQASSGKRFLNYIIDLLFFYVLVVAMGVLIGLIFPDIIDGIDDSSPGLGLWDRFLTLLFYGLYMFFTELIFRGKSLGKLITRTKAVNEHDGSEISFEKAFFRGLSRAVPFEAFSALGSPSYPWHDKWTNTIVINEKLSQTTPGYLNGLQTSSYSK